MVKKLTSLALLVVLLAVAMGAHTPVKAQTKFKLYNYTTYIDDQILKDFEKQFNVEVVYDTFADMDELTAKMQAGNPGYDVIIPSDYAVALLAQSDLLEPLDAAKIPNLKNVDPQFLSPWYDEGNKYSAPYLWGTIGLAYSKKALGRDMTSLDDLWAPDLKGKVALLGASRETISMFLNYLGLDPNSVKKEDLEKVKDLLAKHKENIARFHEDDGQALLAQGAFPVVTEWSGDITKVAEEPENKDLEIKYVIPKEGGLVWTDNMAIPKGATNIELANEFINFVLDAKVGAQLSNFTRNASPNKAAIDGKLIDAAALSNTGLYPTEEVRKKLYALKDIGDGQIIYDQVWAEILALVSQ